MHANSTVTVHDNLIGLSKKHAYFRKIIIIYCFFFPNLRFTNG